MTNNDMPFHLHGEDGARYSVAVTEHTLPDADSVYSVDLVRSLPSRMGAGPYQSLELASFENQAEALAHRDSIEDTLAEQGLAGLGTAAERIQFAPLQSSPYEPQLEYYFGYGVGPNNCPALEAVKTWIDPKGERHFDTLTLAEYGMFEEARTDERELEEVMARSGVERAMHLAETMSVSGGYLDPLRTDGRVFFTDDSPADPFTTLRQQELSVTLTPINIPDLDLDSLPPVSKPPQWMGIDTTSLLAPVAPDMNYSIDLAPGDQPGTLALLAEKWWVDEDDTLHQQSQRLHTYEAAESGRAYGDFIRLYTLAENEGRDAALTESTDMARQNGELNEGHPQLFSHGPQDAFTVYDWELPTPTLSPQEDTKDLQGSAWFEAAFENSTVTLLEPVHDTVNYTVEVDEVDPWTTELLLTKYWREGDQLGMSEQTLDRFDVSDEQKRSAAEQTHAALMTTYDERGLEAMMQQAEGIAMENGYLSGQRIDERLFRQGPEDRFETLAQRLSNEPNPFWNVGDSEPEIPKAADVPAHGSWDELIAQHTPDEPPNEAHYWRLDYRPAETPEGERLGTALFIAEFPEFPPDYADNPIEDSPYPTVTRTLEMAHFANEEDARKFGTEFRSYLLPGVMEGPELAPEVAKLEGLSGQWETHYHHSSIDYPSGNQPVVREPGNWHLHNPNAEREAYEFTVSAENEIDL